MASNASDTSSTAGSSMGSTAVRVRKMRSTLSFFSNHPDPFVSSLPTTPAHNVDGGTETSSTKTSPGWRREPEDPPCGKRSKPLDTPPMIYEGLERAEIALSNERWRISPMKEDGSSRELLEATATEEAVVEGESGVEKVSAETKGKWMRSMKKGFSRVLRARPQTNSSILLPTHSHHLLFLTYRRPHRCLRSSQRTMAPSFRHRTRTI
ncbi:hypothetical protein BT69DRAFT_1344044 [Atractiella rhizophila]|nr:hypothetical protein BT69DRAFT_1344044 [Atractiella rhizophila]